MVRDLRNRRLKAKPLVYVIGILLLTNLFTLIAWVTKEGSEGASEAVATVGDEEISRQEWLHAIELRYGKEVLQQLINQRVMEQSADKFDVSISQEELDQEFSMLRSVLNVNDQATLPNEEVLKEQLKTEVILEKLITNEVDFSEEELKAYYEENKSLYVVPSMYRLSQIVVATEAEAAQVLGELENDSSFEALARERSIDTATASQGGLFGYVPEDSNAIDENILNAAKSLSPGEWSEPIQTDGGFTIVLLHEVTTGVEFSFDDVKGRIERQLAIEQLNVPVTAESFWNEVPITWFYGPTE
ncbi:peptidyl-prolyl cis-trans isomerase [Jeotgalibacillus proteolyticus]|uniref:peptidylprolyl isomerase n=1 Tax=Jeotgalibacillus proteolyticus TaxID=2082395 RepID=A0A2S5G6G1_9BACL|nr:peptidyl-prolyl cis-trans isomerase [Jeotgalibacillus proteolyticus]PPA68555.1 peptidylprolyl isomerase [Jeotgalibacillus proteolyticus]